MNDKKVVIQGEEFNYGTMSDEQVEVLFRLIKEKELDIYEKILISEDSSEVLTSSNNKAIFGRLIKAIKEILKSETNEVILMIAIINKKIADLIEKNIKSLEDEFLGKCEFYKRKPESLAKEKELILGEYRREFNRIATKFEEEYMNLAVELQEAQTNQKLAVMSLKKLFESKENSEFNEEYYYKKMDDFSNQYIKYCEVEEACIIRINSISEKIENAINSVMQYEVKQLVVSKNNSFFSIFSDLFKKFTGLKRFEKEYLNIKKENIEKIKISTNNVIEEMDKDIDDILLILSRYNLKIKQVYN